MARPANGQAFIEAAQNQIASAKSVDALRAAQALLLPLVFGLSLEQTATVIGLSKSRAGKLRTQFQRIEMGVEQPKSKAGLRNHARMTLDEEAAFLAPFIDKAKNAGIIIVPPLKAALERCLGRSVAPSTVYGCLADTAGASSRRTNNTPMRTSRLRRSGKKLPEEIKAAQSSFKDVAPLRLMFQDEARFGRISDTRHCWCPRPMRPIAKAMVTQEYTYAYAAVSPADGALDTLILPSVNGSCMEIFLQEVSERHPQENILMVLDGAGWHKNQATPLPDNLRLLFLPPYSPELNPVEHLWDDLREKSFHNRVFDSIDALESHLEQGLAAFEKDSQRAKSITHWPWIINALFNAN